MRSKFFQNSLVELIDVDVTAAIFVLNNQNGGWLVFCMVFFYENMGGGNYGGEGVSGIGTVIIMKQDACTGVHSACRREENGHNLDIWVLRLRQRQIFLCLKVGKGLDFQKWDLNRAHETERTVFPIPQVFGMCRCRL